jgi:hypothetical protein
MRDGEEGGHAQHRCETARRRLAAVRYGLRHQLEGGCETMSSIVRRSFNAIPVLGSEHWSIYGQQSC